MRRNLADSIKKLNQANRLLAGEKQVKQATAGARVRVELYGELHSQLYDDSVQLAQKIESMPSAQVSGAQLSQIALATCYIKRSANWFFRVRDHRLIQIEDLQLYMEELVEIAEYSGLNIALNCRADGSLTTRRAALVYRFFYRVVEAVIAASRSTLLVQIVADGAALAVNLMPSGGRLAFVVDGKTAAEITRLGGHYALSDLDDAFGITLQFNGEVSS